MGALGVLVASASLTLVAGACATSTEADNHNFLGGGIEMVLRGDAIVGVTSIERQSDFEFGPTQNRVYKLEIGEVLAFSSNPEGSEAPVAQPGGSVVAFEAITTEGEFILDSFGDGTIDGDVLVVLDWSPNSMQSELARTNWNLQAALSEDDEGRLAFLGAEAENLNGWFDEMRDVGGGVSRSDRALLVASFVEAIQSAKSGLDGPLIGATRPNVDPAEDATLAWHDLPVDQRPLDPDIAPPEEIARMVSRQVIIEVAESARTADTEIRILTPEGVSYRGTLEANRQATILLPPSGDFEVAIVGSDGVPDRAVVARAAFMDGAVTLIEVGAPGDETSGPSRVSAASVGDGIRPLQSLDEAAAIVAGWAVEGTPGVEPDNDAANIEEG